VCSEQGRPGRVGFPSFELRGNDGVVHAVPNPGDPATLRAAALAAGGVPGPRPTVPELLALGGRFAAPEVAAACDLPGPLAHVQLWQEAAAWRARPQRILSGELWSAAW